MDWHGIGVVNAMSPFSCRRKRERESRSVFVNKVMRESEFQNTSISSHLGTEKELLPNKSFHNFLLLSGRSSIGRHVLMLLLKKRELIGTSLQELEYKFPISVLLNFHQEELETNPFER